MKRTGPPAAASKKLAVRKSVLKGLNATELKHAVGGNRDLPSGKGFCGNPK